jgi:ABC-type uncharacterized transport system fused permease/ATPase subunit
MDWIAATYSMIGIKACILAALLTTFYLFLTRNIEIRRELRRLKTQIKQLIKDDILPANFRNFIDDAIKQIKAATYIPNIAFLVTSTIIAFGLIQDYFNIAVMKSLDYFWFGTVFTTASAFIVLIISILTALSAHNRVTRLMDTQDALDETKDTLSDFRKEFPEFVELNLFDMIRILKLFSILGDEKMKQTIEKIKQRNESNNAN